MCGIAGVVRLLPDPSDPSGESDRRRVATAAEMLRKRGPDAEGLWSEAGATLAHRRLAILDLSPAGRQPMESPDGRYQMVFNGEVYNFRELRRDLPAPSGGWRSDSDTEVVLAAFARWGAACLDRFHGMFAFAVWDRHERRLFAARDRMGVKPLYYATDGGSLFAFASRPRALIACHPGLDRGVDPQALRLYLEAGYVPAPLGFLRGVRKLPPGHSLSFGPAGLSIERWWDLRRISPQRSWVRRDENELLDELDALLRASVRMRLVSDAPLGAFLSGGVDSSLVTALMARESASAPTAFTIGFGDPRFDESPAAAEVARHIGAVHHVERLEAGDLTALLPTFVAEFDEPFFDSSAFPTMAVARLARRHVTVALSGDGGDELFGGYHYYRIVAALAPAYRLPATARRLAATVLSRIPVHRARLLGGALARPDPIAAFAFARSISKNFGEVLPPHVVESTEGLAEWFAALDAGLPADMTPLDRSMRIDALSTLPDDYLQKVDVSSMAFSLEAREPLLDHTLVEWAMRLPAEWKLRGGTGKYLLKRLACRYLPAGIVQRPKQGFSVPLSDWLKGPLRTWADGCFADPESYRNLPLDRDASQRLWRSFTQGRVGSPTSVWALLVLFAYERARRGDGTTGQS